MKNLSKYLKLLLSITILVSLFSCEKDDKGDEKKEETPVERWYTTIEVKDYDTQELVAGARVRIYQGISNYLVIKESMKYFEGITNDTGVVVVENTMLTENTEITELLISVDKGDQSNWAGLNLSTFNYVQNNNFTIEITEHILNYTIGNEYAFSYLKIGDSLVDAQYIPDCLKDDYLTMEFDTNVSTYNMQLIWNEGSTLCGTETKYTANTHLYFGDYIDNYISISLFQQFSDYSKFGSPSSAFNLSYRISDTLVTRIPREGGTSQMYYETGYWIKK